MSSSPALSVCLPFLSPPGEEWPRNQPLIETMNTCTGNAGQLSCQLLSLWRLVITSAEYEAQETCLWNNGRLRCFSFLSITDIRHTSGLWSRELHNATWITADKYFFNFWLEYSTPKKINRYCNELPRNSVVVWIKHTRKTKRLSSLVNIRRVISTQVLPIIAAAMRVHSKCSFFLLWLRFSY